MTSSPPSAPRPVDWVGHYDTRQIGCFFELDQPGWVLVLSFASYQGRVQLVSAGLHYVGSLNPLDIVQGITETPVPDLPAEHPFRYRWLRDIHQQYEREARRVLRNDKDLLAFLATPDWYQSDAPKKGHGLVFYAKRAEEFIEADGSISDLADLHYVSHDTAHGWIKKARKLGVLSSPGRGKRGQSDLTHLGREVLDGID